MPALQAGIRQGILYVSFMYKKRPKENNGKQSF
jgi:hypothetical protein